MTKQLKNMKIGDLFSLYEGDKKLTRVPKLDYYTLISKYIIDDNYYQIIVQLGDNDCVDAKFSGNGEFYSLFKFGR